MNFKLGILHLLSLCCIGYAQGENLAKNIREFNALCRLFRIAYDNQKKPAEDLIKGDMDWNKIEALYANREQFVNATEEIPMEVDLPVVGKIRLTSKQSVAKVHAMAVVVMKQIRKLRDASRAEKAKAIQAAETVTDELKKALAGETKKKLDQIDAEPPGLIQDGGTNEQRAHACVAKANSNPVWAGISLANDLACLCIPGNTGDTYHKEICGFVTDGSSNFWTGSGTHSSNIPSQLKAGWVKIVEACTGEAGLGTDLTPENITSAIEHFNALLGAQASTITGTATGKIAKWVFGIPLAGGASTCVAGTGSAKNNVCVNYGATGSGAFQGIDWRNHLEKARVSLLQIRQFQKQAAELYETARRIQERQEADIINLNVSESVLTSSGIPPSSSPKTGADHQDTPSRGELAAGIASASVPTVTGVTKILPISTTALLW